MPDIAKLRSEHAELASIVGRLAEMVERDEPVEAVELFRIRRELSSTLIAHLKAEDWALYPRLAASADPEVAATAKRFQDEMGGLAEAYNLYAQRWDAMSIRFNWSGFCSETRDIIAALTSRIIRENEELYPLVERLDQAA